MQANKTLLENALDTTTERSQAQQLVENHAAGVSPADAISAPSARFGKIIGLDLTNNQVKVQIEGLCEEFPHAAKLGRAFSLEELHMAIDNQLDCRVEFIGGDVNLPIISDIFFSIISSKTLVLKAERVNIVADKELTLSAAQAKTRMSGRDGRITTESKYITTQAEKGHFIRGGHVAIN
ncbi:hypothetical protein [Vibrio sp. WXL103]|uniref:hypothetical protein n=1 Tax=unclassified Vibrio TaxID=2614977 RepID=UPI003EC7CFD3